MNTTLPSARWLFCLLTFGCKVNQYESESLREAWQAMNGQETDDPALAHVVVFNSCAITASAVADLRQALRRVRRLNAQARLLVTGCAAELPEHELTFLHEPALAPVACVRQADKARLLTDNPCAADTATLPLQRAIAEHPTDRTEREPFPPFRIESFRRARPVLKVQDGCSHGCAYCIVPLTRGRPRSRALSECVAEARRLLDAGHREIMLSGINLRQFRTEGQDFWDLVAFLDAELAPEWEGVARLRISSVDPAQLNAKGLDTLASSRLVCPHLHLSLQSGSPAVLAGMRRSHYSPEQVVDAVQGLARFWPRFGLGADILMGFPGETSAHVTETIDCIAQLSLSYAHVFPFSERPGTVAATLPHAVPRPERQQRAAVVREVVRASQAAFLQAHLAESQLIMAPDGDGSSRGVDQYYVACELPHAVPAALSSPEVTHTLLAVRPSAIREATLLVERSAG